MPQRIKIVLGGSFNPPTIAHKALLEHAVRQLDSMSSRPVQGVFVPSSDAYVRRKMSKQKGGPGTVLSEGARVELLNGLCMASELRLGVSTVELHAAPGTDDGKGSTYETMKKLQKDDPKSEFMFLLGADKLKILPRWRNIAAFLDEFEFAVTARTGDNTVQLINQSPVLAAHRGSFRIIPDLPDGYAGISSTAARRAMAAGDMEALGAICDPDAARDILELHMPKPEKEAGNHGK